MESGGETVRCPLAILPSSWPLTSWHNIAITLSPHDRIPCQSQWPLEARYWTQYREILGLIFDVCRSGQWGHAEDWPCSGCISGRIPGAGVLTKPGNELVSCKKRISLRLRPRIGIDQTDQNSPNTPPGERERKYFLCNGRKIYCYVGSPVIMHNIQYHMAIGME